jgi:hypothetical protein
MSDRWASRHVGCHVGMDQVNIWLGTNSPPAIAGGEGFRLPRRHALVVSNQGDAANRVVAVLTVNGHRSYLRRALSRRRTVADLLLELRTMWGCKEGSNYVHAHRGAVEANDSDDCRWRWAQFRRFRWATARKNGGLPATRAFPSSISSSMMELAMWRTSSATLGTPGCSLLTSPRWTLATVTGGRERIERKIERYWGIGRAQRAQRGTNVARWCSRCFYRARQGPGGAFPFPVTIEIRGQWQACPEHESHHSYCQWACRDQYRDVEVSDSTVGQKRRLGNMASLATSCRACQREESKDDDPLLSVFCDEIVSDPIGLASVAWCVVNDQPVGNPKRKVWWV